MDHTQKPMLDIFSSFYVKINPDGAKAGWKEKIRARKNKYKCLIRGEWDFMRFDAYSDFISNELYLVL